MRREGILAVDKKLLCGERRYMNFILGCVYKEFKLAQILCGAGRY